MANVVFPFDHAVQITYNANGQEVSRENVTTGIVKCGYERSYNSQAVLYYTDVTHYKFELWFQIPSGTYKYTNVSRAVFSNLTCNYTDYKYYGWYMTADPWSQNFWTEVYTGTKSITGLDSDSCRFQPKNDYLGVHIYNLQLSEYHMHIIQQGDCDYLVIYVPIDGGKLLE